MGHSTKDNDEKTPARLTQLSQIGKVKWNILRRMHFSLILSWEHVGTLSRYSFEIAHSVGFSYFTFIWDKSRLPESYVIRN